MSRKQSHQELDVVIIGSGLYGIQAARYYLDIHPEAKLTIFESDDVAGGVWSAKRIYDAFWTQTPTSMAEFSDRKLPPIPASEQYYNFFPAKYVTAYLESYLDSHIYNDQTLRSRIHFSTTVTNISKLPNKTWQITCTPNSQVFTTSRLIDATGLTSLPYIPNIPGQDSFRGLTLHHKSFGESSFLGDPNCQHVAVLGGGKSAADVAYAAAKAGKSVSWIIREGGNGPAAFLGAEGKGPYKNANDSFYTRFTASWLPNPFRFGQPTWMERFLHGSKVGRWMVRKMWERVDRENRKKADFGRDEGRENGFASLEPDTPVFWQNDSSGVNQRPDLYPTIATKVHVYRQSIHRLSSNSITLSPKTDSEKKLPYTLPLDVLVYCTGWTPLSPLYSASMASELGLPVSLSDFDPTKESRWKELEDLKDAEIISRFPALAHPPAYHKSKSTHTPFRLHRAMVPLNDIRDHSIVFLGKLVVGNNFRAAEVQGLWAVAYLDGNLYPSTLESEPTLLMKEKTRTEGEIAKTVAWCRRRYLNKGELGSWFYFDMVDYTDMLLAELGLSSHKPRGWLMDIFAPCRAQDLKDLVAEYKSRFQGFIDPPDFS